MPRIVSLLLLFSLLPLPAVAQQSSVFYEAEAPLQEGGAQGRQASVQEALAAVVTKVTGRGQPRADARWPELAGAAERLVVQYQTRQAVPNDPGVATPPVGEQLWVRFDRAGVDTLLRAQGLPIWGDARPITLLLVAVEDGGNRYLLSSERMPEAAAVIATVRQRRALPVILPLMDLEDRANLRFTDVWANFGEALEAARSRYETDGILAGRLFREGQGAWAGQWTLHLGAEQQSWASAGDLQRTVGDSIEHLADRLAERFVPEPLAVVLPLELVISGLRAPADYARLMAYLGGIAALDSVWPLSVDASRLHLRVSSRVDAMALSRTFSLGDVVRVADGAAGAVQPADTGLLRLELLP